MKDIFTYIPAQDDEPQLAQKTIFKAVPLFRDDPVETFYDGVPPEMAIEADEDVEEFDGDADFSPRYAPPDGYSPR